MISASGQPGGVVAKVRMGVEALAHLAESPSFDERHFRLREVATRQLFQQLQRRHAPADLVAAGLDRRGDALPAGEKRQQVGVDGDARFAHLGCRRAQAAAGNNAEVDGRLARFKRRLDPPERGPAQCREQGTGKEENLE